MSNLAFRIANHLLNKNLIKEHVQPTMVEGEIQRILNETVVPTVVHFEYRLGDERFPSCNVASDRAKTIAEYQKQNDEALKNQRVLQYDSSDSDDIYRWMKELAGSHITDDECVDSIQAFQVIYEAGSFTASGWYTAIVVVNTVIE